ncbi:MAG TPA: hypothetical protein DC056_14960 [Dehalococcoidia bacterium]|jgi:hypothetical protein|nr:hypothetical protein [Dehalococcoidia bacterium]
MRPSRFKKKRAIIVTTLIVLSFVVSAVAAGLTMASWWTADGITTDIVSLHDAELQGDARYASGVHSKAFSFPLSTRLSSSPLSPRSAWKTSLSRAGFTHRKT